MRSPTPIEALFTATLKRPDEALTELSTAIRLDPKLLFAYQQRSAIYEEKSDWRAMYDDANKLIELTPNDRLGYDMRGEAYFVAGQYGQGNLGLYEIHIVKSQLDLRVPHKGACPFLLNQFDKATQDFDAAPFALKSTGFAFAFVGRRLKASARPPVMIGLPARLC